MKTKVSQFDVSNIRPDLSCLVVGKRRYGKSTFVRDCMSRLWQYFPGGGYVFTPTKNNKFWQQHYPNTRIHDNLDTYVIDSIKTQQLEKCCHKHNLGEQSMNYVNLIFDDCITNCEEVKYIEKLLNDRNIYMLNIWIISQDLFPLSLIPQRVDYIMTSNLVQERSIEQMRKCIAPHIEIGFFLNLFIEQTKDFNFLVFDQQEHGHLKISVCKANQLSSLFRVGTDDFWSDSGCSWKEQLREIFFVSKL